MEQALDLLRIPKLPKTFKTCQITRPPVYILPGPQLASIVSPLLDEHRQLCQLFSVHIRRSDADEGYASAHELEIVQTNERLVKLESEITAVVQHWREWARTRKLHGCGNRWIMSEQEDVEEDERRVLNGYPKPPEATPSQPEESKKEKRKANTGADGEGNLTEISPPDRYDADMSPDKPIKKRALEANAEADGQGTIPEMIPP